MYRCMGCADHETQARCNSLDATPQLYSTTGDSTVCARVVELGNLLSSKVLAPQGYANSALNADWTPIAGRNGTVDYGHDLQVGSLLNACTCGLHILLASLVFCIDARPVRQHAKMRCI